METELDYKAIAEQLQRELEEARIALLNLRQARSFHFSTDSIKHFLRENYVVISAICLILFVFFSLFDTVRGIFTKHTKE